MPEEKDWQAESDCDTLMRAEEIKNQPMRYKTALAIMEKRHKAIMEAMEASKPSGSQGLMKRQELWFFEETSLIEGK